MAKIPVVFTFDKRIILGAAVAIKSLIDTASSDTVYDIYVYHPDIDDKTIKEFEKMLDGTKHEIKFQYVDKGKFKGVPISRTGSWNEIVYYRLLIPELLPQYDKVIYSDVDVLFKKDLADAYNTDISECEFGGVAAEVNSPETICHKYFPENSNKFIYWSGFLLINCKKMREENYFEKFITTAKNFYGRLKYYDLDTLNLTCHNIKQMSLKYCLLEALYTYKDYTAAKDYAYLKQVYTDDEIVNTKNNPSIIHYAGELGKPWRRKYIPTDYEEYMNKIPKSLRRYTFRDFRKRLFSKV